VKITKPCRRASVATLILAALTGAADAQAVCAPRDHLIQRLADVYGETRKGFGLRSDHVVIEIYASDETGTWTLLATRPDGVSCAMAVGEAWQADDQTIKPGEGL